MRQLTIPFCGFVLFVVCGSPLLSADVARAAPEGLQFASVDLPLPLAHAGEGAGEGADAAQGGWRHFVSWVGHFVFEKNRPATFTYPLWSLMGDFKMLSMMATGKIGAELVRCNVVDKSKASAPAT